MKTQLELAIKNLEKEISEAGYEWRNIVRLSSILFMYSINNREEIIGSAYGAVMGKLGAISAFYEIRSNIHLKRAVRRYNKIVSGKEFSFFYENILRKRSFEFWNVP